MLTPSGDKVAQI